MNYDEKLTDLETRLGHVFSDRELLERALTHGSYGDGRRKLKDYERLEFLGDRVLGLLTAEILFEKSTADEGGLARKLNALVRKETCAEVSMALEVGDLLMMSKSTEKLGGREKLSILGDVAESLLAAIYLDGGYEAARIFYNKFWTKKLLSILSSSGKDPKTELQEQAATEKGLVPVYELVSRSGPDHKPHFLVRVSINGRGHADGEGSSKKAAEQAAAQNLLTQWGAV